MIFTGVVTPLKHKLKVIQNICLRLMLGARNTTPIRSWRLRLILPLLILARTSYLQSYSVNCYRPANNETTKLLQIESGSDVVGVHNSFRRRATIALLNIGMHSRPLWKFSFSNRGTPVSIQDGV